MPDFDLPVDPDLGKLKFHKAIVVNQKNYVKLQIGMLINGLNRTRILIALILVLLLNSFLSALLLRTRSLKKLVQ
jgi:hypothetical protein